MVEFKLECLDCKSKLKIDISITVSENYYICSCKKLYYVIYVSHDKIYEIYSYIPKLPMKLIAERRIFRW